jgi:hypothetical protein
MSPASQLRNSKGGKPGLQQPAWGFSHAVLRQHSPSAACLGRVSRQRVQQGALSLMVSYQHAVHSGRRLVAGQQLLSTTGAADTGAPGVSLVLVAGRAQLFFATISSSLALHLRKGAEVLLAHASGHLWGLWATGC